MTAPLHRPVPWEATEPGLDALAAHAGRLARRALAQWRVTLLVGALASMSLTALFALRAPPVEATIVLRVTEGDLDARTAPRPARQLEQRIVERALSRPHLAQIVARRGLYPNKAAVDVGLAVDELREHVTLAVERNYFSLDRGPDDPPRSARVVVAFRDDEPTIALAVARDLCSLVTDDERAARADAAGLGADLADLEAGELRGRLGAATARRAELSLLIASQAPGRATALVEAASLDRAIAGLESALRDARTHATALALRHGAERGGVALAFDEVDARLPPRPTLPRPLTLAALAALLTVLSLPVVALVVGAFDRRIWLADDVHLAGWPLAGRVRAASAHVTHGRSHS